MLAFKLETLTPYVLRGYTYVCLDCSIVYYSKKERTSRKVTLRMKKVVIRNHIMQITTLWKFCSIGKVFTTVFLISVTPDAVVRRCSSK